MSYYISSVYFVYSILTIVNYLLSFILAGVDYGIPIPSFLVFTAAQTIQCTNIQITDDTLIEGPVDETFNITLTHTLPTDPGVQLAPTTAIVSIQDSDGKTLNSAKTIGKILCNVFSTLYRLHTSCVLGL